MKVLITGGSKGIGHEVAKLFALNNHDVLVVSRNFKNESELNKKGVKTFSFDLLNKNYSTLINNIKKFGKIDILINNAGYLINKPFLNINDDELENIYKVNVFAPFKLIRESFPYLSKKSHIINISSIGGVQGSMKFKGLSAYSSSKGAICILTECLAEEFKDTEVKINALALGAVQTEMLEKAFPNYKAPISPKEIAKYIYSFALNDSIYFNGKILNVSSSNP